MIIIFSRSKEANGINEIKRCLATFEDFLIIESLRELTKIIINKNKKIHAIFCLASTEALISTALLNFFQVKTPVVMGVYHPKQWAVMLDVNYSKTRATIFQNFLATTSLKNIIFNTESAYKSSMEMFYMSGNPNLVVAPSFPPIKNEVKFNLNKKINTYYIATVGRIVDFKLKSVLAMINTVEHLNRTEKYTVEYHIFGNGPLESDLLALIDDKEHIHYHGFLEPEDFASTISQFDIYFGMGFTVVHSSMLSIPSLIAIQDEDNPLTYGLFSKYDHRINPMFGDKTGKFQPVALDDEIKNLLTCNNLPKKGSECEVASRAYDIIFIKQEILKVINNATTTQCNIKLLHILMIRLETLYSRIKQKKQIHA